MCVCVCVLFSVIRRQWKMKVEIILEARNDVSDQCAFLKSLDAS